MASRAAQKAKWWRFLTNSKQQKKNTKLDIFDYRSYYPRHETEPQHHHKVTDKRNRRKINGTSNDESFEDQTVSDSQRLLPRKNDASSSYSCQSDRISGDDTESIETSVSEEKSKESTRGDTLSEAPFHDDRIQYFYKPTDRKSYEKRERALKKLEGLINGKRGNVKEDWMAKLFFNVTSDEMKKIIITTAMKLRRKK